eukprot:763240-Pyramimonas_sp.AAC.1
MALDPEVLAALPPDIQEELIQQQAEVAAHAARRAARATMQASSALPTPAEMDSASIIATFPPDLREEVLLNSDESLLAALPPDLLAEAQARPAADPFVTSALLPEARDKSLPHFFQFVPQLSAL